MIGLSKPIYPPNTNNLRKVAAYGPAFVVIVTLLALWELCVRAGWIANYLLPAPI